MNKLDEYLKHLNCQCSDGGCIFRPSDMKGMVTNGGCKCCGDYNKKHQLERLIRWMQKEICKKPRSKQLTYEDVVRAAEGGDKAYLEFLNKGE